MLPSIVDDEVRSVWARPQVCLLALLPITRTLLPHVEAIEVWMEKCPSLNPLSKLTHSQCLKISQKSLILQHCETKIFNVPSIWIFVPKICNYIFSQFFGAKIKCCIWKLIIIFKILRLPISKFLDFRAYNLHAYSLKCFKLFFARAKIQIFAKLEIQIQIKITKLYLTRNFFQKTWFSNTVSGTSDCDADYHITERLLRPFWIPHQVKHHVPKRPTTDQLQWLSKWAVARQV